MKNLALASILAITLGFASTEISYAACSEGLPNIFTCDDSPPNPDLMGVEQSGDDNILVNVLPNAAIDTQGQPGDLTAIDTANGDDEINVTSASVRAQKRAIDTGNGDDVVNVNLSLINSIDENIMTGNDDDTVNVIGSDLESTEENAISTGNDNDKVNVDNSILTSPDDDAIDTGNDNDMLTITDSIITGGSGPFDFGIRLGNDNDMLTLNNGVTIIGGIQCGNDIDTIVFAMEVPLGSLERQSLIIAQAEPAGDTIEINGLTYTWENCELLVNDLKGVSVVRPIPTLSEWGLVAMAGLIGITGLIFYRRRATA